MIYIIFASVTSLAISFLFMPLLINLLEKGELLDEGGHRKIHKGNIPSMGGIVIFIAFMFSILAWLPATPAFDRKYFLGAISLIALLGIRDDFAPTLPRQKLLVQFIAASIIVLLTDIRVFSFYGFLGIEVIPVWISYIISVLFIVFITNAFNLIDGIDGLAGLMGAIGLSLFGVWFYFAGFPEYSIVAIVLVGAILGFLYYNWHPASIFMGDTGSLVIGFTLSICAIWFFNLNASLPDSSLLSFNAPFSIALGVLLFPIFDTARIVLLRARQRKSPFVADRQHTHHHVLRMTKNQSNTTIIITLTYLIVLALIMALAGIVSDNILIPTIIIFCILLDMLLKNRLLKFFRKRHSLRSPESKSVYIAQEKEQEKDVKKIC